MIQQLTLSQKPDSLNLIYGPTAFFVRLSLILMLSRMFCSDRSKRYMRYSIILILLAQTLFFTIDLAISISSHSQCVSVKSLQGQFCNNLSTVLTAQSAVSVTMDFAILLIPIVCIWRMQCAAESRWKLIGIFSIGFG